MEKLLYYQRNSISINKATLIERIADLVKDKRVTGITDLRDESDRDGIRVVIEVKKGEEPELY